MNIGKQGEVMTKEQALLQVAPSKRAEALKQLSLDKHERFLIKEAIIKEKDEEIESWYMKAKDEEIKELGEIVQQYLIPSKNYDEIIKAKDDEIRRLNNLYADTIKDLGDALIEIEMLKAKIEELV